MSSPQQKLKTNIYRVQFSDGKGCTVLDMNGNKPESERERITEFFKPGYVVNVTLTGGRDFVPAQQTEEGQA